MTNPTSSSAYPAGLAILLDKLQQAVADLTAQLEAGDLEAVEWEIGMGQLLARYSLAAYMVGADTAALTASDISNVAFIVQTQLSFLDNFTLVIQSEAEFQAGWTARAQQYAQHIVEPYWKGATRVLPLPAMPGDGTFCECRCSWSVETIDEEKGDYNATWVLGHVRTSHCAICEERAKEWNPLQIRNGRIVIGAVNEKSNPNHDPKNGQFTSGHGFGMSGEALTIEPSKVASSGKSIIGSLPNGARTRSGDIPQNDAHLLQQHGFRWMGASEFKKLASGKKKYGGENTDETQKGNWWAPMPGDFFYAGGGKKKRYLVEVKKRVGAGYGLDAKPETIGLEHVVGAWVFNEKSGTLENAIK